MGVAESTFDAVMSKLYRTEMIRHVRRGKHCHLLLRGAIVNRTTYC